jgi:hypothetical protein
MIDLIAGIFGLIAFGAFLLVILGAITAVIEEVINSIR